MNLKFLIVISFLFCSFFSQAQKSLYLEGLKYFEVKNYDKALTYFYADKYAYGNKDLLIRRVISNYHIGKLDEAKKDVSTLLAFENIPDETFLYIGKIFHAENKFKKAVENYKTYLRRLPAKSEKRDEIIHTIKQCGHSIRLKHLDPLAFVDNYGSDINTRDDEFRMIQSPNFENKYYFSAAREGATGGRRDIKGQKDETYGFYNSDMYSIEMTDGKWLEPTKLNPLINTSRDEVALDFSTDGSILFYLKGPDYSKGTIYTDTFSVNKKEKLHASRLNAPINAEEGDVYLNMYNNNTILFSSKRKGGFGGYDIYVTSLQDGNWSKPKNLGSSINTRYNEISPCITNDGLNLFFSSDQVESIGGYDVFYSEFNLETFKWEKSTNMGIPVNSSEDDLGLYVSKDGFTASLSSNRKQGYGGFDLYVVYFKNQIIGQLNPVSDFAYIANDEFIAASNSNYIKKSTSSKASSSNRKPKILAENTTTKKKEVVKNKKVKNTKKAKNKKSENSKKVKNTEVKAEPKEVKKAKITEVKKQEYIINPIFYTSDNEIISASNERELSVLINLLTMYPDLNLDIRAHTVEEGLEAYDLYFSIKRAERVGEYLVSKGIVEDRIMIKGYGSNYPVAKTETGGKKSKIAQKVNSRMEFTINNIGDLPIELTIVEPYLVDYLRDPKGELFKTIEDGLSYRVQIASVKQMYQNQVLLLYNDSMIEKELKSKNYRYTLGLYEDFKDARVLVKDLANYNITGAFIVPYIDGQRISKTSYAKFADKYPDLLNFIQYNDE